MSGGLHSWIAVAVAAAFTFFIERHSKTQIKNRTLFWLAMFGSVAAFYALSKWFPVYGGDVAWGIMTSQVCGFASLIGTSRRERAERLQKEEQERLVKEMERMIMVLKQRGQALRTCGCGHVLTEHDCAGCNVPECSCGGFVLSDAPPDPLAIVRKVFDERMGRS
jgi:hypothetical protein